MAEVERRNDVSSPVASSPLFDPLNFTFDEPPSPLPSQLTFDPGLTLEEDISLEQPPPEIFLPDDVRITPEPPVEITIEPDREQLVLDLRPYRNPIRDSPTGELQLPPTGDYFDPLTTTIYESPVHESHIYDPPSAPNFFDPFTPVCESSDESPSSQPPPPEEEIEIIFEYASSTAPDPFFTTVISDDASSPEDREEVEEEEDDRKVVTSRKSEVQETKMVLKKTEETRHISCASVKLEKTSAKIHNVITNGVEKSTFQEPPISPAVTPDMNGSSKEDVEELKPTVDPAKVVQKFNQQAGGPEANVPCKICGKHVYQMEKLKAEKAIFHKLCFRCIECKKLLTLDTYQSHEGSIYCRQHFRLLFQPKVRLEEDDDPAPTGPPQPMPEDVEGRQRRHEMIIRENIPEELPPDVVRCEAKPDYGLESLPSLHDVKTKFETGVSDSARPPSRSAADLQRSDSIMQRMAKYQSAVRGENGDATSESEDEEGESHVINKTQNDKEPIPFSGLSTLKSQWEQGAVKTQREEIVEMKKEEQKRLRQRMCLGRSESMRQVYEKACHEATTPTRSDTAVTLDSLIQADKIKEKFEKGQVNGSDITHEKIEKMKFEKEEDLSVFAETGIAHDARSLFKKMDATARTTSPLMSPSKSPSRDLRRPRPNMPVTEDVVKCSEPVAKEEIKVETVEISQRFKFFENYHDEPKERKRFQMTPPREEETNREDSPEPERDPNVVRCNGTHVDIPVTDTARKMLDKFKAIQEAAERPETPAGPKPLKRITPPRDMGTAPPRSRSSSPQRDPDVVRCTDQLQPELPEADTARILRQKFERWEADQPADSHHEGDDLLPQIDTAKNLKAKFEAIKDESLQAKEKPIPRVKRFV